MTMSPVANRKLVELFEARTGQHLSPGRQWRIGTALSGIFREEGISSVDELMALLTKTRGSSLTQRVVEALLNNETYFLRDRAMFEQLGQQVLPDLFQRRTVTRRLNIWSAGCSTGQEVLSLALLFAEQGLRWADWDIDILGTDISQAAIEAAEKANYSHFAVQRGLSVMQMLQWFDESGDGWQARDTLRKLTRFQVHNIFDPPPVGARCDLVLCRNVLLYFDGDKRRRVFDQLASAMAPDGWLMLGAGETVVGQTDRFVPHGDLVGIYRLA